jgi:hypothetical protein
MTAAADPPGAAPAAADAAPTTTTPTPAPTVMTTKQPGLWERWIHGWQCWALAHPQHCWSRVALPWVAFVQGVRANQPPYFLKKRARFGNNFCVTGAVVLGDYNAIEEALIIPHARTHRLGQSVLDPDHLPGRPDGNRLSWILALSQQQCGGNGDFEAFRAAFEDIITNEAALLRTRDATAQRLIIKLALDYKYMEHGRDSKSKDDFFNSPVKGLKPFIVRFIHYSLLGMDPFDNETMDTLLVRRLFNLSLL